MELKGPYCWYTNYTDIHRKPIEKPTEKIDSYHARYEPPHLQMVQSSFDLNTCYLYRCSRRLLAHGDKPKSFANRELGN